MVVGCVSRTRDDVWSVDVIFFFKQKTAYEMRISDWSSDVCSSDLRTLEVDDAIGYGAGVTVFSLNLPADGAPASRGNGVHVAFEVERRDAVDAFFQIGRASCRERVCQYV